MMLSDRAAVQPRMRADDAGRQPSRAPSPAAPAGSGLSSGRAPLARSRIDRVTILRRRSGNELRGKCAVRLRLPLAAALRLVVLLFALLAAAQVAAQPVNDNFASASPLAGATASATGSNVGATAEAGEPSHLGQTSHSVWWQWTAPSSGNVVIDTVGSNFDTVLAVYTGSAVNALTPIASNDDTIGLTSRVAFPATSGTVYRIAIDGFGSDTGSISLQLAAGDPPPVIGSNPPPGTTITLSAATVGGTSSATLDLFANGGMGSASAQVDCTSSGGVLIGANGGSPAGVTFNQNVVTGNQPVDVAIAAIAAPAQFNGGLSCVVTPSLGSAYTLTYTITVPAALAPNAPPTISSLPANGARIVLRGGPLGAAASGTLDLIATAGAGSGSAAISCTSSGGVRIGTAGSATQTQVDQNVAAGAAPADLTLAATIAAGVFDGALACSVTPSTGGPYALNYTIRVPAALAAGTGTWVPQGPAPTVGGQSEGITNRPVSGAVHAIVAHPSDANIVYVGAVNGGVWKTTDALAASPTWVRLTDAQTSLSIGAIDLDITDGARNTLLAGMGRFSSYGNAGGSRAGLIRSTDGGASWSPLSNTMSGRNISGVVARGATLLAGVDVADNYTCGNLGLFRSTDTGASWTRLTAAEGLPSGAVDALAGDRANPTVLYASLALAGACAGNVALNGIYRSADTGATWTKISTPAMDALFDPASTPGDLVRIAVGPNGHLAVAIARNSLLGVFHSSNSGGNWTTLTLPATVEGADTVGLHPGGQGSLHLSLAIDPNDPFLVYVGGDRQPVGGGGTFPNSLGANDFSGRLFRGDARIAGPAQWTSLTHAGAAGNSSPHADSRTMTVDAAGRLLEGDDGGIHVRLQPTSSAGAWRSLNGDLQITEQHSSAYDRIARVGLSGNQDNGTMRQSATNDRLWNVISGGDGGDVAVDRLQLAPQLRSVSYTSSQNLGGFRRRVSDADNAFVSSVSPGRAVTGGGAAPTGQFTTPIATNQAVGGRLVIGGGNAVFESLDSADTLVNIGEGIRAASFPTGGTLAYGAQGNPDVLYVAGCRSSCAAGNDDGVFVRTALGGALILRHQPRSGATMRGVALDPDDPAHAFAVESTTQTLGPRIVRTTTTGTAWVDVTGDLPAAAGDLLSIAYLPGASVDAVVVGTDVGVYLSSSAQDFDNWIALGSGLPRAPVHELAYDPSQDLLQAGTLGRGAFTLSGVLAPPFAADDSANATAGVATTIPVLGNDVDAGGTLVPATLAIASGATGGATATVVAGAISFTAPAGFSGTSTFTYRVADNLGVLSNTATVTVTVAGDAVTIFRNGFE
jgi:hypothetical protein